MTRLYGMRITFEAVLWTVALVGAAIVGPSLHGHFTFCVPTMLGFEGCWGCGIGIGIAETLRGNIVEGFHHHPFAPFAVLVLFVRIVQLTFPSRTFAGVLNGQCAPRSSGS